jgi:hypothetical protein
VVSLSRNVTVQCQKRYQEPFLDLEKGSGTFSGQETLAPQLGDQVVPRRMLVLPLARLFISQAGEAFIDGFVNDQPGQFLYLMASEFARQDIVRSATV